MAQYPEVCANITHGESFVYTLAEVFFPSPKKKLQLCFRYIRYNYLFKLCAFMLLSQLFYKVYSYFFLMSSMFISIMYLSLFTLENYQGLQWKRLPEGFTVC